MSEIKHEKNKIMIRFEEGKLTDAQVRLMKTLNALLLTNLTTQSEGEYFDTCAEIMRACAGMIKQSSFASTSTSEIPYAKQALEFSIDVLLEHVEKNNVIRYDN